MGMKKIFLTRTVNFFPLNSVIPVPKVSGIASVVGVRTSRSSFAALFPTTVNFGSTTTSGSTSDGAAVVVTMVAGAGTAASP
jgi:hypothetical protein